LSLWSLSIVAEPCAGIFAVVFPVLKFAQYPFRFVGVFNLLVCLLVSTFSKFLQRDLRGPFCLSILLLVVLVYSGNIAPQLYTNVFTSRGDVRKSLMTLDQANQYMPIGSRPPKKQGPLQLLSIDEVSMQAVRVASRIRSRNTSYSVYNGTCLPFSNATFHLVLATCVLHHIPPLLRKVVIGEALRVTKPTGGVVSSPPRNHLGLAPESSAPKSEQSS